MRPSWRAGRHQEASQRAGRASVPLPGELIRPFGRERGVGTLCQWAGGYSGGREVVGRPSQRAGRGQRHSQRVGRGHETFLEVLVALPKVRVELGGPPGALVVVRRPY